jgi:mycofactocin system creatininase family protein
MSERHSPTSTDIEGRNPIVILPLGSWEQHGPHLPLDTDSLIINAVVESAVRSHPHADDFFVAPTLPITASDEHAGFAGGLSTGTSALVDAVVAICRSASAWARGVLIANGHGGNIDALRSISSALDHERIRHSVWSLPSYAGGDMHAGRTETSVLLHLDATSVRHDLIPPDSDPDVTVDRLRESGVKASSPSGVLGRPSEATKQHGESVMNAYRTSLTERMSTCVEEWPAN